MIAAVLGGVLAGLLALRVYQRLAHPFLWADVVYYCKLRSYGKTLRARMQRGIVSYLDCFLHQAKENPHKPFVVFENQTLTYRDAERRSNRFANAFGSEGFAKRGDVVALLMFNEPDFICAWLGLCKAGCQVAFLNAGAKAPSLRACLRSCGARTLVVGAGSARFPPPVALAGPGLQIV